MNVDQKFLYKSDPQAVESELVTLTAVLRIRNVLSRILDPDSNILSSQILHKKGDEK
jgi:hypothetical protein